MICHIRSKYSIKVYNATNRDIFGLQKALYIKPFQWVPRIQKAIATRPWRAVHCPDGVLETDVIAPVGTKSPSVDAESVHASGVGSVDSSVISVATRILKTTNEHEVDAIMQETDISLQQMRQLLTVLDRQGAKNEALYATRSFLRRMQQVSGMHGQQMEQHATLLW